MKTATSGALVVAVVVGALAFTPWLLMLVIGALYHQFGFWQPIGFWGAVLVTLALGIVGSFFRGNR